MFVSEYSTLPQTKEGLVQSIDLVERSVTVMLEDGSLTFDVHPRCEILLNGERVKLRLLQPRDRTHITFCRIRGCLTALIMNVTTRQMHH